MKTLLAVDGSEHSKLAVRYLIDHPQLLGESPSLTIIHVDPPLTRHVADALGREEIERYHADNAKAALRHARSALKRARVAFEDKAVVGDPASAVVRCATAGKFELIVMGSHGRGAFRNLLLGSVATKVLSECRIPVLIVR